MKRMLFIFVFNLYFGLAIAQNYDMSQYLISGGGDEMGNTSVNVSFSLGDVIIDQYFGSFNMLTQGYLQTFPSSLKYHTASGFIYNEDEEIVNNCIVQLFSGDLSENAPAVKELETQTGTFAFSYIPEGHYYIMVTAKNTNDYLPTYLPWYTERNKAYRLMVNGIITNLKIYLQPNEHIGVNQYSQDQKSIYPNPTTNKLNIRLNNIYNGDIKVNIYSAIGTLVYSSNENVIHSETLSLDVTSLRYGVYTLNILGEGLNVTSSFVKINH